MRSVRGLLSVIAERHCIDLFRRHSKYDETLDYNELENVIAEEEGVALGKVIQPSRLALSGRTVTPGMFDVMVLLGREKTLERMDRAIAFAEKM